MADIKISELPAATAANNSDEFETNQAGVSRKVTREQLLNPVMKTQGIRPPTLATGDNFFETIAAGGPANAWHRFRRSGSPSGTAGTVFSSFSTSHFFTYPIGTELRTAWSDEATDTPALANATDILSVTGSHSEPLWNFTGQVTLRNSAVGSVYGYRAIMDETSGTGGSGVALEAFFYGSGAGPVSISMNRAGGSEASPTALVNNFVFFRLDGSGYDGTQFAGPATFQMHALATENWSATGWGTRFRIRCVPQASTSFLECFGLDNSLNTVPGSTNNALSIGSASNQYSTAYLGSAPVVSSDARLKTGVKPYTDTELECACALADEIGWFKWLEAVDKKGDAARRHHGQTVQRAIEVLTLHGMDPMSQAFICHDAWEAKYEEQTEMREVDVPVERQVEQEDGTVKIIKSTKKVNREFGTGEMICICVAGDRYSFRENELQNFMIAGIRWKQRKLEDRIAMLEAK